MCSVVEECSGLASVRLRAKSTVGARAQVIFHITSPAVGGVNIDAWKGLIGQRPFARFAHWLSWVNRRCVEDTDITNRPISTHCPPASAVGQLVIGSAIWSISGREIGIHPDAQASHCSSSARNTND